MAKRRSEIEPSKYIVNKRLGNKFEIINEDGETREISRVKIHPKNKSYQYYQF